MSMKPQEQIKQVTHMLNAKKKKIREENVDVSDETLISNSSRVKIKKNK